MTGEVGLRNLGAFAVQAGLLVLAGAFLARVFRIREPRASLSYWRTLLVVCLLLPVRPPWPVAATSSLTWTVAAPVPDGSTVAAVESRTASPERASIALE